MPLAWNEIRHRAMKFANDWGKAASEAGEKQTFWNEFFQVFGVARKTVASFEAPVRKVSGHDGFIDLFWKGVLLVEHKSLGGNLGKAQSQAFDYIQALAAEGKHHEIPRYVMVSDFARIVLYDLEPDEQKDLPLFNNRRVQIAAEFPLQDFHKHIRPFAFIAGYKQQKLDPEDPANLEAAKIMADLHDALRAGNYTGHELRVFLVRILFCLFAEDTGIFGQPRMFELYLTNHTAPDGSDLGLKVARLFEVLNTPVERRQRHLEADLAEFPYVNGDLFKEHLAFADFNSDMRNALLGACGFRWEKISPAVFGSLFQEVMEAPERRQLGAHYTAEKNIMKVVRSLFLDDLRAELEAIKNDRSTRRAARLDEFHDTLASLRFLDPACGCGNFLVITYRELRVLELEILVLKHGKQQHFTLDQMTRISRLDVDQMFGIELEEFPARICLWLVDAAPDELRALPEVMRRVEAVREERAKSKRPKTNDLAKTPSLFGEIRQPARQYLAIPKTSSERRAYIPMAFLKPAVIAGADIFTIPDAEMYHFGVLTSQIHMAWVRYVCGRLKSDYRYSAGIVYNNFPWPPSPTTEQKAKVEAAAQAVLKARAEKSDPTLAGLYDPLTMPTLLVKAHTELDRAVDRCYRKESFPSDRARVEFLFKLYEQLTAPLIATAKPKRSRRPREMKAVAPPAPPHPGLNRDQAAADAAHFYSVKEEPPPYRTK